MDIEIRQGLAFLFATANRLTDPIMWIAYIYASRFPLNGDFPWRIAIEICSMRKVYLMDNRRNLFSVLVVLSLCLFSTSCKKEEKEKDNDDPAPATPLPSFNTCESVANLGGLTFYPDEGYYRFIKDSIVFVTISLDGTITMTYDNEISMTYQLWGYEGDSAYSNHENLNGKHIKDRFGKTRSVIYPDGTKITLVVEDTSILHTAWADFHQVKGVVIRSGNVCHYINMLCGSLEYSANHPSHAAQIDALFPDGETSSFELTPTGLIFFNSYNEEVHGQKVYERVDLGEIFFDSPTQVNDYFDDPRLGHT